MKDEEKKEVLQIIFQIEQKIEEIPDYEEISLIHDNMEMINEKLDKILEKLE